MSPKPIKRCVNNRTASLVITEVVVWLVQLKPMFVKSKHSWRKWILWPQNYHLYVVARKTKHFNMVVVEVLCWWATLFKLPSSLSNHWVIHSPVSQGLWGGNFTKFVEIFLSLPAGPCWHLRPESQTKTTLRWKESGEKSVISRLTEKI